MKTHRPKKESVHVALWNVAAIAGLAAVMVRSQVIVTGATVIAVLYHVVFIFIDESKL